MLNFKQPLQNTESNRKDNLRNLYRTHHGDKMDTPMRIDLTRPGLQHVDLSYCQALSYRIQLSLNCHPVSQIHTNIATGFE